MDFNMELLLNKLEEKLHQQTLIITTTVTANVTEALNEKMNDLIEENRNLKNKVHMLEQKLKTLEKNQKKRNLVFFGLDEEDKNEGELIDLVKELVQGAGTQLDRQEISNIFRIGLPAKNKKRPLVVTITTNWKKRLILRNKSQLPKGIYIKEDYSKEELELRKLLQPQVEEERSKGNIAFLKRDKLIVKTLSDTTREKRKREKTVSPNLPTQKKKSILNSQGNSTVEPTITTSKEVIKPSILNYVSRGKSTPTKEFSKNK